MLSISIEFKINKNIRRTLHMNILVVGNGFDLAHDLPTSYKDFLYFTDAFIEFKTERQVLGKQIPVKEDAKEKTTHYISC